jgi:hypothetical protein
MRSTPASATNLHDSEGLARLNDELPLGADCEHLARRRRNLSASVKHFDAFRRGFRSVLATLFLFIYRNNLPPKRFRGLNISGEKILAPGRWGVSAISCGYCSPAGGWRLLGLGHP